MKIKLINYTQNAEETIASAGKLCYSSVGVDEIDKNLSKEAIQKYINMLNNLGHESPIEHASFTFAAEGISRSLSHQLVRHRLASYSQQSQRYVKINNFEYIIPPSIEENEEAKEVFIKAMQEDQKNYSQITDVLFNKNYNSFIKEGIAEKEARRKAEKLAIEDARYVFPNACETKIVFTMNTRSLMHFFSLRCCNRAQWEIRNMAFEMVKICKKVYPTLFKNAGPNCINGPCPEGKMSCGKLEEVRELYSKF
ncbi:FAD-dependent thymidylate synthase [Anaerococcus nagyae]|uniref:FAD-dependent thymidylate synthase n=1 Tax=Anaerococcus nagyae TaxID=1755241 RepID=UPI001AEA65D9|nr:FAD-dependent thymidylate synthase [Anaerococcus nagyae]MBP2070258.1 thymidylate synthase (FAD) [Anaerococcus nagyae]